jgi:hypothetical protein
MTGSCKHAVLAALVSQLLLSGCATAPRGPSPAEARESASPQRPLASPGAVGERAASQVVRAEVGSRELTLNCVVTIKDGVMSVVGLNAMGMRLFTVTYDGTQVHADTSVMIPDVMTSERLLADLQLVYWPLRPLRETLQPAGFEVTERRPGTRRLLRAGRWLAEVHYAGDDAWSGRAWLINLEFGYSLQIDSRPQ